MIKFGPSGRSQEYVDAEVSTAEMPKKLKELSLNLYEYSFGRGVRLRKTKAMEIHDAFKQEGIELTIHAPFFINFASFEESKILKNPRYLYDSMDRGRIMGATRCIFHLGSLKKNTREEAFEQTKKNFINFMEEKTAKGYNDMYLCPETLGKFSQVGTLDEVLEIVNLGDDKTIPCIDFGHINSYSQGKLKTRDDYRKVLDKVIDQIGFEKTKIMHIHFAKIEYGKRGEIRHLNFDDEKFGPEFEPMLDVIHEYKLTPYVVCESASDQTQNAKEMLDYYNKISKV